MEKAEKVFGVSGAVNKYAVRATLLPQNMTMMNLLANTVVRLTHPVTGMILQSLRGKATDVEKEKAKRGKAKDLKASSKEARVILLSL